MAIRHHAFGFDETKYLDAVARAVGPGTIPRPDGLAVEARRIVGSASAETRRILEHIRFDDDWLTEDQDTGVPHWLALVLIEHLEELPSLSGREPHAWLVLDRILPVAGWPRSDVDRFVRGAPLSSLPASLGRRELEPVFLGAREPGGVLSAREAPRLDAALTALEARFRGPRPEDAAALADWAPASTPEGLASVMAKAFEDAATMLGSARGRSIFLIFE